MAKKRTTKKTQSKKAGTKKAKSEAAPAKTPERRGGRKPGTPNHPVEHIESIPPACPKCRGTAFEGLGKTREDLKHAGVINGRPYNVIRFLRRRCKNAKCGQISVMKEYHLDQSQEHE